MTKAEQTDTPSVSIVELANQLPVLLARSEVLVGQADRARHQSQARAAYAQQQLVIDQMHAIEDFVLAAPAVTLADAAVQIMVAYERHGIAKPTPETTYQHDQVKWVLLSALRVAVQESGLDLSKVAGAHYLPECGAFDLVGAGAAA